MVPGRSGKCASPSFQFGCLKKLVLSALGEHSFGFILTSSSLGGSVVYFPFSALFPALTPLMAAGDVIQALITAL